MGRKIDRREALIIAGGLAVGASAAAEARPVARKPGEPTPLPMPIDTMFQNTQYFEIDSVKAGARYAVWVTTPKIYDKDPKRSFAAIYTPDGNGTVMLSPVLANLSEWDFIDAFQPTIQICVGYTGEDADRSLAVRARDLLPPKEALMPGTIEGVKGMASSGLLDQAGADLYAKNLQNPAGDRFLAFLTEELHPFIAKRYRIQSDNIGLFGHSYGGLFATYAALQKSTIFRNIGASSPGILPDISILFKMYRDAAASGGFAPRNLHMTVGAREITAPGIYQMMVAGGAVEFMRVAGSTPLKGLNFSSRVLDNETHITVMTPAIHDFLRAFYMRPKPPAAA